MAKVSKSSSVQIHGWNKVVNGVNRRSEAEFYVPPNVDTSPNMSIGYSITLNRETEQSSTLNVSLSGYLWRLCKYTSGSSYPGNFDSKTGNYGSSSYGYHMKVYIAIGNSDWKQIVDKPASDNKWTSDGYSVSVADFNIEWPSNNNIPFKVKVDGGCYSSQEDWCISGHYETTVTYYNVPYYNPYTAPSTYSITLSPNIGRVDYTDYGYNYTISGGTGIIDWVYLKIYPSSVNWNYGEYNKNMTGKEIYSKRISDNTGKASASGSGSFKCLTSNKFTDGSSYKVAIHFSDSNYEWISGSDKSLYTYTKPETSATVKDLFSPQDEPTFTWTVNNGVLGQETNFKTTIKLNNKVVNNVTGTSLKITNNILNQYFSTTERSVSQMSGTLYVENENISAAENNNKYVASTTKNFTVQYKPVKTPTNGNVSNSGQTIIIQDTPNTTVSWSYPHMIGAAGVVNGYIVRVYTDSSYSSKFGEDKVVTVSTAGASGYISLDNKTDLKRGVLNYATITPYYNKPDGSGRLEGDYNLKVTLVKPVSRLDTPTISYPTNGAQWHNKYFRVLLQLPADDDLSAIKTAYGLSSNNEYKYADIELKVTAGTQTFTYSINSDNTKSAFSTNDMYYQRKIAINPSYLSNFPNVNEYTISIRVKKKYYNLSDSMSWSKTATIKISNIAVNRQTFIAGQTEITSTQYSYVRNASVRLNKAYPFKSLDSRNIAQNKGDQIDTSEYTGIYQTIKDIQNGINGYCTYDNTNIKLNQTIDDFTINPPKVELITANDNVSDLGRNYKNLLVDDMNKLY